MAGVCGRSSSAVPTSRPATWTRCSCPAGTPSPRSARPAPRQPRRSVQPRAARAGISTKSPSSRPTSRATVTPRWPDFARAEGAGPPAARAAYDYQRAARDAICFAALFDRFVQNLRRFAGYDVQYFAAIEPQRRLAPHVHVAIRGTISRTELRQVLAATYHQVWWPPATEIKYGDGELPVWHEGSGNYLDAATGEVLPTWDQALDAIGDQDDPWHMARFGERVDAQGGLAGAPDATRRT